MPEKGMLFGLTYGLSLAEHELWQHGKPELCIGVRSRDPHWVLAVAHLAEDLRGDCPFQYGDRLNFGQPIAADSAMDGFIVLAPAVVDLTDACIEVGDEHPVHLVGLYPTYRSERRFAREYGLEALLNIGWDPHDVSRPAVA